MSRRFLDIGKPVRCLGVRPAGKLKLESIGRLVGNVSLLVEMPFVHRGLGRVVFQKDQYYLTQSMNVTFRCSVSPGVKLHAMAKIKKYSRTHFTAEAKVYGPEGEVIATGEGRFVTMQRAEVKRIAGKK